ncbi:MAG: AAA family ATPase [Thermoleophilia bacterium]
MYVTGWHVDGFGIFSDYVGPSLGPGLTVLLGPNEAGKSTLLAFIRGTLFGFKDKRSASTTALYPPVPGCRYGGRLYLADDDGTFTVDRDAGRLRAQPTKKLAGDVPGDPSDLQRLLGGADETLFRTVFAFSLTELQNLDSMSDEHISDRIFSAGLKGAGQSAQAVLAYFDERAAALYRQRGKSTIGQLLADLRQNGDELTRAERAAADYPDHRAAVEAGVTAVGAAQATARQLRNQKERLESLLALWPVWSEYRQAQSVLVRGDELPDRLQIASLAAGLALHRQRRADQPAAAERHRSAAAAAAARLAELGADVTVDTLAGLDVSLPARDQLRAWAERLQASERATADAKRAAGERAGEYRALGDEHQRLATARNMQASPPASELDERAAVLAGLRADLQDLRQAPPAAGRALGLARLGMVA